MTWTTRRTGRDRRRYGLAAALALLALMICAGSAPAATKDYSLTIAPSTVLAGEVVDIDATFTNLTSQQQLGSANLTPPAGYTALSVNSLSLPLPATATISGGVIQLRSLSLPPQGSVTVSFKVSTPCVTGASATWDSVEVKQANDFNGDPGNGLVMDTAVSSITTTTISVCVPCVENESCSGSLAGPVGSSTNVISDPIANQSDAGALTLSIVNAIDCAGYTERTGDTFNLDTPPNRPKDAVLTYSSSTRRITSKDPLEVCFGSPLPFAVKAKTLRTTAVFDGQLFYVGRLPTCNGATRPPCVTFRDDAARSIGFTMPPGDPRYG